MRRKLDGYVSAFFRKVDFISLINRLTCFPFMGFNCFEGAIPEYYSLDSGIPFKLRNLIKIHIPDSVVDEINDKFCLVGSIELRGVSWLRYRVVVYGILHKQLPTDMPFGFVGFYRCLKLGALSGDKRRDAFIDSFIVRNSMLINKLF